MPAINKRLSSSAWRAPSLPALRCAQVAAVAAGTLALVPWQCPPWGTAHAVRGEIGSVASFARELRTPTGPLLLASCGVRDTLWVEHYAAGLYLRRGAAPQGVLDPGEPKALRLRVLTTTYLPEQLPGRWRRALERALDADTYARARRSYLRLSAGDTVTIVYLPGSGVSMQHNGRLVAQSDDHRVVEAMLDAWAGDEPIDDKLERLTREHPCA